MHQYHQQPSFRIRGDADRKYLFLTRSSVLCFSKWISCCQCRLDEAEIQSWYIEKGQYDFVIYDRNDSDVMELTRKSDIWSKMEPGTRIVMRIINEEVNSTAI